MHISIVWCKKWYLLTSSNRLIVLLSYFLLYGKIFSSMYGAGGPRARTVKDLAIYVYSGKELGLSKNVSIIFFWSDCGIEVSGRLLAHCSKIIKHVQILGPLWNREHWTTQNIINLVMPKHFVSFIAFEHGIFLAKLVPKMSGFIISFLGFHEKERTLHSSADFLLTLRKKCKINDCMPFLESILPILL